MRSTVNLSQEIGIERIIVCSAWGVNETYADLPFWFRWPIKFSQIDVAYEDHGRQENILNASNLDWTIVRPAGLTNSEKTEKKYKLVIKTIRNLI